MFKINTLCVCVCVFVCVCVCVWGGGHFYIKKFSLQILVFKMGFQTMIFGWGRVNLFVKSSLYYQEVTRDMQYAHETFPYNHANENTEIQMNPENTISKTMVGERVCVCVPSDWSDTGH